MQVAQSPRRRLTGVASAVLGFAALTATPALAQSGGGAKIGVVDVEVVRTKIMELKQFAAQIQNEQQLMEASVQGHQAQIKMMQDKLNQLKPDTDEFDQRFREGQDKAAEFQIDDQRRKNDLMREVNRQNKKLYLEIQDVVAAVAKKRGLDLVINEPEVRMPTSVTNVDPQQLSNLINTKSVLYVSPTIDLTDEVVLELDARFKASGGATGAANPPAK
jgi:Skp family chaperone for outer membrane proteins